MDTYEDTKRPDLLALCRERGLSGAGTNEELVARLRSWDTQQDDVAQASSGSVLIVDEDDPLGLDEPEEAPVVEADHVEPTPVETPPADGPASRPSAGGPGDEPAPALPQEGQPPVADAHPRVFQATHQLGDWEVTDDRHFELIARTRAAARDAGHDPKGGETIGTRVRYGVDGDGVRTVTYEVPLRRRQ